MLDPALWVGIENMDIDNGFWLLAAFWLGTCVGFAACALMRVGRSAGTPGLPAGPAVPPDLMAGPVSRV